jgi:YjbE family integral membrane protein
MDFSLSLHEFWIPLGQILLVNIVLSGDNAVVIALAARSLPPKQQKLAIFWGSGAAIIMRILLTIFAVKLLTLPYLKLIGAVLLVWIGIQLLRADEGEENVSSSDNLMTAIKTILLADLVMSLDNVLGVAAAAKGSMPLLIIGLAISIPLVIFGASLLLKVMERFPIIITIGGGLLGWVAGDMAVTDPAISGWLAANAPYLHHLQIGSMNLNVGTFNVYDGPINLPVGPLLCTALVLIAGKVLSNRHHEKSA